MKTVSNVMAGEEIAIVLVAFVLNACGVAHIDITDALKVGGFYKGEFPITYATTSLNDYRITFSNLLQVSGKSLIFLGNLPFLRVHHVL